MKSSIVTVLVLGLAASRAHADPKADAKKHMEAAARAYKENRYDDTLVELNAAYALDPRPELHYSIGQVYAKLGRCADALLAYESFLASKPSPDRVDLANQAMETCKAQLATATPPPVEARPVEPVPPPVVAPPPPPTQPAAQVDAPAAWYKDKLGLGLAGGGVVVTVVGLVLYAGARSTADDAANADNYAESQSLFDDAKSQRTTAVVVTLVGLAATGAGAWRLWQQRREEQRSTGVALVPANGGGMLTISGGF